MKIAFKMREISIKKKSIIQNMLKIKNKERLEEEMQKPEIKKMIKDMRQNEIKKINNEIKEQIKELEFIKNKKLDELKHRKKEGELQRIKLKEEIKSEELNKKEKIGRQNYNIINNNFNNYYIYNKQKTTEHGKHFQCYICGKIFRSKMDLNSHCRDKYHFIKNFW